MTIQLLLSPNLTINDVAPYHKLIDDISKKRLGYPQVKKTKAIYYQGEPVLRAKIDSGGRVFYQWKQVDNKSILFLLKIDPEHNYKKTKRALNGLNPKVPSLVTLEDEPAAREKAPEIIQPSTENRWAIITNNKIIEPDEEQKKALQCMQKPARKATLFKGPPGAGKTTILNTSLMLSLENDSELIPKPKAEKIFFFSHSQRLLSALEQDVKSRKNLPEINFTSWINLLRQKNPGKTLIFCSTFGAWFTSQKCSLVDKPPEVVHYEFSLIMALGFEQYNKLGERQCYYAKYSEKKKELNKILQAWLAHLDTYNLIDPMVSTIPEDQAEIIDRACVDEAQNMPPVALRYLIQHTPEQGFSASLDSQQCLTLSPYIENCLITLLQIHYGSYSTEHLSKSWRCSELVAQAACNLMDKKYKFDNHYRRDYKEIQSALAIKGIVSWISRNVFNQLQDHCKDPETAVLIPDNTSEQELLQIKKAFNKALLLCYSEAIGLDLKNVILWKPFSLVNAFKGLYKNRDKPLLDGLNLAQWKAFNALFVAITRASTGVYIFEEDTFYLKLGTFIMDVLPTDIILSPEKLTEEELAEKLQKAIELHLEQNQIEIACKLMKMKGMTDTEIESKIKPVKSVEIQPVNAFEPADPKPEVLLEQPVKTAEIQPVKAPEPAASKPEVLLERKPRKRLDKQKQASVTQPEPEKENASSTPKRSTSANNVSKFASYACDLIRTNNPENLKGLFRHKNFIDILFNTPMISESPGFCSLFLKLIHSAKWAEPLITLICAKIDTSPELIKELGANFLYPSKNDIPPLVLMVLFQSEVGRTLLSKLLFFYPTIFANINADILINYYNSPVLKQTLFHILCESNLGPKILLQFLQQKPRIAKEIPGSVICQIVSHTGSPSMYNSPLLLLLYSNTDLCRSILDKLTQANPNWLNEIRPEVLCKLCPKEGKIFANTSVLYWLVRYNLPLFKKWSQINPKLLQGITAEAFFNERYNFSVFLGLISSGSVGFELLDEIMEQNPNLKPCITIEDLDFQIMYTQSYTSPLHWLTASEKGLCFLGELLQDPELAGDINAKVLCKKQVFNDEEVWSKTIFSELTKTSLGIQILGILLGGNPGVLPQLTWEALSMPMDNESKVTPLVNLALQNLKIFAQLVEKNQNFAARISHEVLNNVCKTSEGNVSLASILKKTPFGKVILCKIEQQLSAQSTSAVNLVNLLGLFNTFQKPDDDSSSEELQLN